MEMDGTELIVKITELSGEVRAIHRRFDEYADTTTEILKKHDGILMGNGQPGLKTDVSNLKEWKEAIKGKIRFWSGIAASVLVIIIVSYLGLK